MSFTAQFLYLLGLGLLPMMLGGFVPRLFDVGLAYDALLWPAASIIFGTIPRRGIRSSGVVPCAFIGRTAGSHAAHPPTSQTHGATVVERFSADTFQEFGRTFAFEKLLP